MATDKFRVCEEGNNNFRIAKYDAIKNTYDTPTKIGGLVSVDITFSRTTDKKAADDLPDYLVRRSPLTGSGTITFIGLTKAQQKLLYANIVDENDVLTFGDTGEPQRLGIMFDNTEISTTGTSINRMAIFNVVFDDPNLNTQTIAEDNTEIRDYTINVNCSAILVNGKSRTYSKLNSVDDAAAFTATENAMYIPDTPAVLL